MIDTKKKSYYLVFAVCAVSSLVGYQFHMNWNGKKILLFDRSQFVVSIYSIGKDIFARSIYDKQQNSTTVVTAFFFFAKSKHSLNEYKQWLENLLSYTENPMVIFTSQQMLPLVKNLRAAHSKIVCKSDQNCFATVIIADFDTPWEMPPIKNIKDALMLQLNIDPEKRIHSPDLYAVWNAKPWMLEHVALRNPFGTQYFLWVDAGAFRSTNYRFVSWPNQERAEQIFEKNGSHKLLLGLINRPSEKMCIKLRNHSTMYDAEHGPLRENLIQGAMFGGSAESIQWWSAIYYKTIRLYISKNWFVGKDQDTMTSLALAHPGRINVILTFEIQCGDPWFAFGPLFADYRLVAKAFGHACQLENISSAVVPFVDACLR